MKTFLIYLLILFLEMANAAAQETEKKETMGGGAFTIGYGFMDVSKMHEFVPENVGTFSNQHLLLGGEGHGIIGRFVIGGSGQALMGDVIKTAGYNYRLAGGMGTFDFGYLVMNKEHVKVFPMLGVGGGGYGIQIIENKSVSVKEVVNDPGREIDIATGGLLFEASVTLNFIPVLSYDEKKSSYGGFMTGLKAVYIYRPPTSDWQYAGGDVTDGPDFGLSMFYVKLMIGGFGHSKK